LTLVGYLGLLGPLKFEVGGSLPTAPKLRTLNRLRLEATITRIEHSAMRRARKRSRDKEQGERGS